MTWRFHLVDVFTSSAFAGNALAVLPDARGLTTAHMQTIAGEFNFSETTFVFPDEASATPPRVRIFTSSMAIRLGVAMGRPSAIKVLARKVAAGSHRSASPALRFLFGMAMGGEWGLGAS
jgi:predicted PhzF superfamily epimerase YddE/YHI9